MSASSISMTVSLLLFSTVAVPADDAAEAPAVLEPFGGKQNEERLIKRTFVQGSECLVRESLNP